MPKSKLYYKLLMCNMRSKYTDGPPDPAYVL